MRRGVETTFREAVSSLENLLTGSARAAIVAEVSKSKTFDRSVRYLRDGMRAHRFESHGQTVFAAPWVRGLDQAGRKDGFHVLHDWDGKVDRFRDDTIPVEAATFIEQVADPVDHDARRRALFILFDYYAFHLLALIALRAWDEGDPSANLDDVNRLLGRLQSERGSGQYFARDSGTLLLIATSHFEPDTTAYDRLLAKVRRLDFRHRLEIAITHGAILGSHLRFGLEVTCAGSVHALREDNVPDYPWLSEAISTLLQAYSGPGSDRDTRIGESLFTALTADLEAFLGSSAASLAGVSLEQREMIRVHFAAHRELLLSDFESRRPAEDSYSPLAFTFNFPHNLVKGIIVDASLRGQPWTLGLDDLLTSSTRISPAEGSQILLARRLMAYAVASPDIIRGQPHPAIVYDPAAGLRTFDRTLDRLSRAGRD